MESDFKMKTEFVLDVIKRYDGYIATTNFKVALLMSFVAAIVLGLSARLILISPSGDRNGEVYFGIVVFSLITIVSSLVAAVYLLRVVFPNTTTHPGNESLIFFGDVSSCKGGIDGYVERVFNAEEKDILEDWAQQAFVISKIAYEKFEMLKAAISVMKFAVIPFLVISLSLTIFWIGK